MLNEEIQGYIREHLAELYGLLLELAVIPAPLRGEERRAAFCLGWLKNQGAEAAYTDDAGNVIYPYRADREALIVFMAHMDVVFPDPDELPLHESEGRICCPGIGDDTANLAVMLMAAKYMAQYQPDTGKYGILFVCGVGEEGLGNLKGSREICSVFGGRIEAFYALDLTMESYTERAVGSLRYRVAVEAKGGHSYHCFGNTNANAVLAELICGLYRLKVPKRGNTTYNVGMISGGTSVNTIAQHAEMLYEIRSDEKADIQDMERQLLGLIEAHQKMCAEDCCIRLEKLGERPCEGEVDREKRQTLFRYVEAAVESATGKKPRPVPCSTDCNIPLSMGIPSVCIGAYRGAGAHTREEYIERDSLKEGFAVVMELVGNYF